MASNTRTFSKSGEHVTIMVVRDGNRQAFRFSKNTTVRDAVHEVTTTFGLKDPSTKMLIHTGRVLQEDAIIGNVDGTTSVQLVDKAPIMIMTHKAQTTNLEDHDKHFGFCSVCKCLVSIRPVLRHCQDGKFVLSEVPDYYSDAVNLSGKCLTCQKENCKATVTFECTACNGKDMGGVILLRMVRKNSHKVPCINCTETKDEVIVFPCCSHCLCHECFVNYCQAMMNSKLFSTFPNVGYSINCPAPGPQCKQSPVIDPHHFCLVDNKGPFYSKFKDEAVFHADLPPTSILCFTCKAETDLSSAARVPRPPTAPVPPSEHVPGMGFWAAFKLWWTRPRTAPVPRAAPPTRQKVSCRQCQAAYCCECKMLWHEGACHPVTEETRKQELFSIKPNAAEKGKWPS